MSQFIINVTNRSADVGTIFADIGFGYTDNLNHLNEASLKISGLSAGRTDLVEKGALVEIKRDGTREFHGVIDKIDYLEGGAISAHASGYEIYLAKEKGAYANSPWTSTASATIFSDIIGESSYFTTGTMDAGASIDFKAFKTTSLWNAAAGVAKETGQDLGIDYINSELDILDHKGTSSSVATFNDGIQIRNIRYTSGLPIANKVIVLGKGDGANQIVSNYPTYGQDATSQGKYGIIDKPVKRPDLISQSAVDTLAEALVVVWKEDTDVFDFDVINPNQSIVSGDHIVLNIPDRKVSSKEVRVVGIRRGMKRDKEFLECEVGHTLANHPMKSLSSELGRIKRNELESSTYMQGSTAYSTWGQGINGKTDYPLKVGFYVSSAFQDEAGNLKVNSLTVDYDIDKFRQTAGSASFDGTDPQVQNTSGNTEPGVTGSSANTAPGVSGSAGSNTAGVSGTSSSGGNKSGQSTSTVNNYSLSSGTNSSVIQNGTFNADTGDLMFISFWMHMDSGGPETLKVKIRSTSIEYVWDQVYQMADGDDIKKCYAVHPTTTHSSDTIYVDVVASGACICDFSLAIEIIEMSHTHADGSYGADSHNHSDGSLATDNHLHADGTYSADNHSHPDGTYDINATDLDHISIGDGVSESGSINSSSVNIYLDLYTGGAWVNQHSILNTGNTLDTDVDITDSGTYPNAVGWWRVRIEPITATPDYIQGIVKMKYHLDS